MSRVQNYAFRTKIQDGNKSQDVSKKAKQRLLEKMQHATPEETMQLAD